jgi:hypothetical protein
MVAFIRTVLLALATFALTSPGWGQVTPVTDVGPLQSQTVNGVTVRVGVPDAAQAWRIFGVNILDKAIQPVWVEIANNSLDSVSYFPITTDPTYFSPNEAAYRFNDPLSPEDDRARADRFVQLQIPIQADPGQTISGFVFTHRDSGLKFLTIGMINRTQRFDARFVVPVAGPGYAVQRIDFDKLVPQNSIRDVDWAGLKAALAELPCCTTNKEGTKHGDPLNVVLVGNGLDVAFPMVQRGWRFTQGLDARTAVETAAAFVFRLDDPDSPVSPLYVFGRPQDVALQKARRTINERNHLRLWLTPLRYQGQSVWIGQISRDIGVELSTKSWYGTTHKIDPMVDFDRFYLLQDLLMAGAVAGFGHLDGVGLSSATDPRLNLEGDPYITDGRRLLVLVRLDPTQPSRIVQLDFDAAPPEASGRSPEKSAP